MINRMHLLLFLENILLISPSHYVSGWKTTWRLGCCSDCDGEASLPPDDRRSVVIISPCGDATSPSACCHGASAHQSQHSGLHHFLRCPQGSPFSMSHVCSFTLWNIILFLLLVFFNHDLFFSCMKSHESHIPVTGEWCSSGCKAMGTIETHAVWMFINLVGCPMMLLKLILCCGVRPSCYFSSLCNGVYFDNSCRLWLSLVYV